ncbi:hypothetical protein [Brachybacterium hainanense]|uniref:TIGR00374 family protein n=1 Tax=Brachybacterium hainanense TaxID=1541174 RepID=A0ABV6R9P8_9MICO
MSARASAALPQPEAAVARTGRRSWQSRILLLAVAVFVVVMVVRLHGRIDLHQVTGALGRLPWWSPVVLIGLLVVRQVLNAAPLAIFLPGAGLYRSTINDLSAATTSAFAPPPSDMVLRVAMFRTWGMDPNQALAATTMNAITFFIGRFSAPILGFALLPLLHVPPGLRLLDAVSIAIAALLVAGVLLVVRGQGWAAAVGRGAGRAVRLVRRRTDPEAWARTMQEFQGNLSEGAERRFPQAMLATYGVLVVDLLIFTASLRMLGVGAGEAPLVEVAAAYLFAYPLTMFPAQGLGVMDSAMLGSLAQTAGPGTVEPSIAAAIVWRTVTVAGPFALGLIAMLLWRRDAARRGRTGR